MTDRDLPSPAILRKLLRHDPETGLLFWRDRTPGMFPDENRVGSYGLCRQWNKRHAGKEAFRQICKKKGYRYGAVLAITLRAHRVIWALHYGEWPDGEIDHINGDPGDNRISNLRVVTASGNARNRSIRSDNTSGVTGVGWHKAERKWVATIRVGNRQRTIGYFASIEAAAEARSAALREHGYHPNHGRSKAMRQSP